jgi:flagellar biosynthetic protein FliO
MASVFSRSRVVLSGVLALASGVFSPAACAAESSAGYTFMSLLMFVILLAAVAALAWLTRCTAALRQSGGASIRLVAAQGLGQRERVVVVNVGARFFLLGHTAQQISFLAELSPEDVPQPPSVTPPKVFADLLQKIKK